MGSANVRKPGAAEGTGQGGLVGRRVAVLATVGVVVLGVAAAFIIWGIQKNAPATTASGAEGAASGVQAADAPTSTAGLSPAEAELARAAKALKFHLTTDTNVGIVETLPADTTLLPPSRSMLAVGQLAPDFSLKTPLGDTVNLATYRGRTVLLEFFATWCPHCQAEAQHLRRLYATLRPDTFAFLSVNADGEDPASLYAFHGFFGIDWPVLLDPATPAGSFLKAGAAGAVTRAYGVALYPTFYIIDPKGRVAWRNDREQPDLLLIEQLQDAASKES
jgi:peroxiredoxin